VLRKKSVYEKLLGSFMVDSKPLQIELGFAPTLDFFKNLPEIVKESRF
jgi:hypothetical protein